MSQKLRLAWVSSWDRQCGIADYSKILWPTLKAEVTAAGGEATLVSLDEYQNASAVAQAIAAFEPDLVHFQHEYGLYGGKNPPFYWFPKLVQKVDELAKAPRQVATGHTILDPLYRFGLEGRGVQTPLRLAANLLLLPTLRRIWSEKTWGQMDGVIVHSDLQRQWVQASGALHVATIPHFVPPNEMGYEAASNDTLLVFGFFTPEKGQDIAIEAFAQLPGKPRLVLAGGVRRPSDQAYFDRCRARVEELKISDRVTFTGFVSADAVDALYRSAALVIAPFRDTSGSGSLVQALARGAPVLASDLALNRELNERVPGCIATFASEDPTHCARQIERLLKDASARTQLSKGAREYARKYSPGKIAELHLAFYRELLSSSASAKR